MPDEKKPDENPEPVTHEELAAAAMAELIEESKAEGGESKGPPDWLRKAFENT